MWITDGSGGLTTAVTGAGQVEVSCSRCSPGEVLLRVVDITSSYLMWCFKSTRRATSRRACAYQATVRCRIYRVVDAANGG